MTSEARAKPNAISKQEVLLAWQRVKANKGAPGVDGESIEQYENKLLRNLYKLWNRMSSGSYFPQPVRRVEIPKKDGSKRPLGIPTVADRVAQEVVRARLEPVVEPLFHPDSYGYRPGKSARDAITVCRKRCWERDWVLDVDIQKFFDSIDHELLMKAVRKHSPEKWVTLYIERWLVAPIDYGDGRKEQKSSGTPQGGIISPLLANLFLHYAFDRWMRKQYPSTRFERYADDVIIHCEDREQAERLKEALSTRLSACGLQLHPVKTRVVYCADSNRKMKYPDISFTFLGYTFQPRSAKNKQGMIFTSYLPAASREAQKQLRQKLRKRRLQRWYSASIEEVATELNPLLGGWFRYFRYFYQSELRGVYLSVDKRLIRWAENKYRMGRKRAVKWLQRVKAEQPLLFAHWQLLPLASG